MSVSNRRGPAREERPRPGPRIEPSSVAGRRAVLHPYFDGADFLLWAEALAAEDPLTPQEDPFGEAPLHPRALRPEQLAPRLTLAPWPAQTPALPPLVELAEAPPGPRAPLLAAGLGQAPPHVGAPGPSPVPAQGPSPVAQLRWKRLPPYEHTLVLPTGGSGPLPSPGAGGETGRTAPLQPWRIPGLALSIAEALPVLRPFRLADPALRPSPGWAAWWRLAAIVRGLVQRGAVLPTLARDEYDRPMPMWQVVPGRADLGALDAEIERLPCSVVAAPDRNLVALRSAVNAFMQQYGDVLVRGEIARRPEFAPWRKPERDAAEGVHYWLAGLLAPTARHLSARARLTGKTAAWLEDPLGLEGPARLVLRLQEPLPDPAGAADDAPWMLHLYLEPPGEPGALVAAQSIWDAPTDPRRLPDHGLPAAREQLREGLEVVGAVFPPLAGAYAQGADPVELTLEQAWTLLTVARAPLERAGVKVLAPAWWLSRRPQARLHLRSAPSVGQGLLAADHLVQFSWEVAVGDATLGTEEFEHLVARRLPLVQIHGQWLVLPPDAAEALRRRWHGSGGQGELPAGAALLLALQAEAEVGGGTAPDVPPGPSTAATALPAPAPPPDVELRADAHLRRVLDGLAGVAAEAAEPAGFVGRLRPYQRRGLGWLQVRAALGLGAILADDMGLGKTVQVLALLARRRVDGCQGPTLIVAPTSVVANWAAEAERFTPGLRVLVHHGAGRARGTGIAAAASAADLVLTSYALLLRDAAELGAVAWDGAILDEAQNVKNSSAKQSQAARRLNARYRLALTGTPVENALTDLWSICAFVQPGYLGSAPAFRRRLAGPVERGDQDALHMLRRLMAPFLLRRTKREPGVADELPPKIETTERCGLTPEQAALYEACTRDLLARVEDTSGLARRAAVLLALLRLKQVCNHPAHFTGDPGPLPQRSAKLDRLMDLLAEVLAEGEAALVFTQFAAFGRRLAAHLGATFPQVPVLLLDGATPAPRRAYLVRRFQALQDTGAPGVFVLSLKAGGAGLNLTAAQHVFHFDRWWNPAVEEQATDRAYRIGQARAVHVHRFVCTGTVEERIDRLIASKQELVSGVLGQGEAWLTELSDAELRDLLTLRRSALGE